MIVDIRQVKNELRAESKEYRKALSAEDKQEYDNSIEEKFFSSYVYIKTKQVFTYVSTDIEVSTRSLIERALAEGRRVACPRCVDGTRRMEFYYITSMSDLENGAFGVLEPNREKCELVTDFSNGVCVVPGLDFDYDGYRLGYGKGYYDRFLSGYNGFTVGLCYSECVKRRLPHGRFDRHVGLLLTERYARRCR